MAAPESTKLQVNFKLSDGTLINIYADNAGELESLLTTVQDTAPLIGNVSQSLGSVGTAPSIRSSQPRTFTSSAPVASAPSANEDGGETIHDKYGNVWVYNLPTAPDCNNGKMVLKKGTSEKTGRPYKGWYDPAAGPLWDGPKIPVEQRAKTIWA